MPRTQPGRLFGSRGQISRMRDDGEAERGRGPVQGDQLPGQLEDVRDRVVLLLAAEDDVQLTEHDRHADAREHPVHDGR